MSDSCGLIAITPPGWKGLPLHCVRHNAAVRLLDKNIETPVLVFWMDGGTVVDIHRTARQHWHFRGQANHFDLYAEGDYNAIFADATPSHKLIVPLPPDLIAALLRQAGDELGLENCRFQFADRMLERLLRRLLSHATEGEPLGALYTESLSVAVLNRLARRTGPARRQDAAGTLGASTRRSLVELIENKLSAPPSIPDMALLSGLRTSDFLKAFRAAFGLSPHQYLLERRVEKAKDLLKQDRSLTAIALELGFASHAHFSATFRARTGETPSEYRDGARSVVVG